MIDNLRRGDTVVTAGGILGKVVKAADAEDAEILVEIADNVQVGAEEHPSRRARQGPAGQSGKGIAVLQVSIWTRVVDAADRGGGHPVRAAQCACRTSVRAKLPPWLPNQAVSLGLDLQGGSYLLLEVDFDQVTARQAPKP